MINPIKTKISTQNTSAKSPVAFVTQSSESNIAQFIRETSRESIRSSVTGESQNLNSVIQGGTLGALGVEGVSLVPAEDIVMSSTNLFNIPSPSILTAIGESTPEQGQEPLTNKDIIQQTDFESSQNDKKHEIVLISDFKPFYLEAVQLPGISIPGVYSQPGTFTLKCFNDALEHRKAKSIKLLSALNEVNRRTLDEKRLNNLNVAKFFHENFVDLFNIKKNIDALKDKINPSVVDVNCVDFYSNLDESAIAENIQNEIIKSKNILSNINIELATKDFSNTKIQTLLRLLLIDLITTKPFENNTISEILKNFLKSPQNFLDTVHGQNKFDFISNSILDRWFDSKRFFLPVTEPNSEDHFFDKRFKIKSSSPFSTLSFFNYANSLQIKDVLVGSGLKAREIIDIENIGPLMCLLSREISISMRGSVNNRDNTAENIFYDPSNFIRQHMTGSSVESFVEREVKNNNSFLGDTLFGVVKKLGPLVTPSTSLTGNAEVRSVTYYTFEDRDLTTEDNKIIKSSYQGLVNSLLGKRDLGFSTSTSEYVSLINKDISILSDLKKFGYVPIYSPGTTYSEVKTSNKFFKNIYYRFFNERGEPKFIIQGNKYSEMLGMLSFTDPIGYTTSGRSLDIAYNNESKNYKFIIKYGLFQLIWSICSNQTEQNIGDLIQGLDETWKILLKETRGDKELSYEEGETDFDFESTDYFSKPWMLEGSTEPKSLFTFIISTMYEFYQIIANNCVKSDGRTVFRNYLPKELMLLLYEALLSITIPAIHRVSFFRKTGTLKTDTIDLQDSSLSGYFEEYSDEISLLKSELATLKSELTRLETERNALISSGRPFFFGDSASLSDQAAARVAEIERKISDIKTKIDITDRRIKALENLLSTNPDIPRSRYKKIESRVRDFNKIDSETLKFDSLLRDTFFYLYGFDIQLKKEIENIVNLSQKTSQFVTAVSDVIQDPNYLQSVMSKDHLASSVLKLSEMISVFQNNSIFLNGQPNLGFLNSSLMGDRTKETFLGYMKTQTGQESLKKSRIVSVGIPSNFRNSTFMNSRTFDETPNQRNQSRFLKIGIGIINLRYPNIVFEKQYFRFDLDKFVIKNDEGVIASTSNPYGAIPFTNIETDNFVPSFVRPNISTKEKEMHNNLVRSYFLELYTRTLTGISLSEDSVFERRFFNSMYFKKDKLKNIIPQNLITQGGSTTLDSNPSAFSSYEKIALNMIFPKRFDRVFNVIIDQKSFKVDVQNTNGGVLAIARSYSLIENVSGVYRPKDSFPLFDYCIMYSTLEFED